METDLRLLGGGLGKLFHCCVKIPAINNLKGENASLGSYFQGVCHGDGGWGQHGSLEHSELWWPEAEDERECSWDLGTKCSPSVTCSFSSSLNSSIILWILEGLIHSLSHSSHDLILSERAITDMPRGLVQWSRCYFPFPSLSSSSPSSFPPSSLEPCSCYPGFYFMIHDHLWRTLNDPQSLVYSKGILK